MTNQRCAGCDEPKFMCTCNELDKSFVGKKVAEVYHWGRIVEGQKEEKIQHFLGKMSNWTGIEFSPYFMYQWR